MKLEELLKRSQLTTPDMVEHFHVLRQRAFATAVEVYEDRADAYNTTYHPMEEQLYGPVSLVSEIFKRAKRMGGILSPTRPIGLSSTDLNRLVDNCVDTLNYTSWLYALVCLATSQEGNPLSDDAPDYLFEGPGSVLRKQPGVKED